MRLYLIRVYSAQSTARDICSVYISLMAIDSSISFQLKTTEVQNYNLWSVINRPRVCFQSFPSLTHSLPFLKFLCLHLERRRRKESLKSAIHIEFQFEFKFNATPIHYFNEPTNSTEWIRFICSLCKQTWSRRRRKQCTWSEFQTL